MSVYLGICSVVSASFKLHIAVYCIACVIKRMLCYIELVVKAVPLVFHVIDQTHIFNGHS